MKPEELLYAESHEWLAITEENGRKVGLIGITDFAVKELNDIVHMVLPKVGAKVAAGKEFGEVESVKAVSPLYSPVNGEVLSVNDGLPKKLEILATDPYGAGWMLKVALAGDAPTGLLDLAAYRKQCESAGH